VSKKKKKKKERKKERKERKRKKETHTVLITKTSQFIFLRQMDILWLVNYTEPINTFCGQNAEHLNVKVGGTCGYHCALRD
jgi:hypothetical protein